MRIMSYNTFFGGFDSLSDSRYRLQVDIIREFDPDILMVQEARGFLNAGGQLLYRAEADLGRRCFIAAARHTGQNTAIFIKSSILPLSFEEDAIHFHHAAAIGRFGVPGFDTPITGISVHLCPNSPAVREKEASYLFGYADPGGLTIVAGDFNSVAPGDPEPDGLDDLPARHRMRYATPEGLADRSTMAALFRSGFMDVALRHELQFDIETRKWPPG